MSNRNYVREAVILSLFLITTSAGAQTQDSWVPVKNTNQAYLLSNYRSYATIPHQNIAVPTVLEFSIPIEQIQSGNIDVFDITTNSFVNSNLDQYDKPGPHIVSWTSQQTVQGADNFFDSNTTTYSNVYLQNSVQNSYIDYTLNYDREFKSESISLILGSSEIPDYITLSAEVDGVMKVLINNKRLTGTSLSFPAVTSKKWYIKINYSQPFTLREISLSDSIKVVGRKTVRFLALPNDNYRVYANTDKYLSQYSWTNQPNLVNATVVKNVGVINLNSNDLYMPPDQDKDGVIDSKDNCPNLSNPDQEDLNNNNIGDKCDDFDLDVVPNNIDNCINAANQDQRDTDGDRIGDKCDVDESRWTEKYPFVIWFVLGFATLVFLALLFVVSKKIKDNSNTTPPIN